MNTSKPNMLKITAIAAVTATITALTVSAIKKSRHINDVSKILRRMNDAEIADMVDSMTEEEFYEYTELVKDKAQLKRLCCIKRLNDDLRELEALEDENFEPDDDVEFFFINGGKHE